jgi:hypothetical protein
MRPQFIPEQLCQRVGFKGPHTLMWYCTPVGEGFVTQLPLLFLSGDRSMRPPFWSNTCNIHFVFNLHTGCIYEGYPENKFCLQILPLQPQPAFEGGKWSNHPGPALEWALRFRPKFVLMSLSSYILQRIGNAYTAQFKNPSSRSNSVV